VRRGPLPRVLAALALAAALAGCGGAPRALLHGSSGRAFAAPEADVPGIDNFAWLSSDVARGAQPDEEGFRWLRARGFRTVITLRQGHDEEATTHAAGLGLVEIPVQAGLFGSSAPTPAQLATFFATVRDSARRPVFFHCARGRDRTGTFAALYRIEIEGWTNEEAIEEMQAFGYNDFYDDLIGAVRAYRPSREAAPGPGPAR
jgi:protein tyrosine/serine phosphatase